MAAKVVEVHPGIFEIFLPLLMRPTIVNVYLLDCYGAWALIDTGMNTSESLATLEDALGQVGIKIEDLDVLIGTHHHVDHFGASSELRRRSRAATYLHVLEAERANRMLLFALEQPEEHPQASAFFLSHGFPIGRYPLAGMRPRWMGTKLYSPVTEPDHYLKDGDVIEVGKRKLEVIWTPGHTPGHCVIYLRKERVMIAGDHLLPKITPHVGIYPETGGDPLGEFLSSQLKVQRYEVALVLPAHGAVYHDHCHRANQLIEHHRCREVEMLDLIRLQPATAFEVSQQLFSDEKLPMLHVMMATFETLAHLEHACLERRARKTEHGGRILFQAR